MRWVAFCAALMTLGCGEESTDQSCIRNSNCSMGWYCARGVCRSKTPTRVVAPPVLPSLDAGSLDASVATDAAMDASSAGDAALNDTSGALDAAQALDASSVDDAGSLDAAALDGSEDVGGLGDTGNAPDAGAPQDASVTSDATVDAGSLDAALSDLDILPDAEVPDLGLEDTGPEDTGVRDTGIRDVPRSDLAPDAGITDRGFGSFPLPNFDTGFGKPR